jgi:hypothetical protein
MKYPDDIDFFYFLENHGWSTCLIFVEGRVYEMGPTHIFENPIEVLLNSMTELLQGANETEFVWHDEPGEYKWSIKRNLEQKHKILVSITECTQINTFEKPKLETLNFEVKLKLFSICILRQMDKIRDLMSEKSFKEHREGGFPYNTFKEYKLAHEQAYS